jgi:hypothetical protein
MTPDRSVRSPFAHERGEGRWFSLATGLKDPLGRTGAVTALQAGLARWWAQAAAR